MFDIILLDFQFQNTVSCSYWDGNLPILHITDLKSPPLLLLLHISNKSIHYYYTVPTLTLITFYHYLPILFTTIMAASHNYLSLIEHQSFTTESRAHFVDYLSNDCNNGTRFDIEKRSIYQQVLTFPNMKPPVDLLLEARQQWSNYKSDALHHYIFKEVKLWRNGDNSAPNREVLLESQVFDKIVESYYLLQHAGYQKT